MYDVHYFVMGKVATAAAAAAAAAAATTTVTATATTKHPQPQPQLQHKSSHTTQDILVNHYSRMLCSQRKMRVHSLFPLNIRDG